MIIDGLRVSQHIEVTVIAGTAGALLQQYQLGVVIAQFARKRLYIGEMPHATIIAATQIQTARPADLV